MDVNRVLVKSVKGSSEDTANIVLANFVPQHHYSINVVMRYVAGSRSTVNSWKSYPTKVRHREYIQYDEIEIEGEQRYLISSGNNIINDFPPLIGYGKSIAIVTDYRLALGRLNMGRYYKFFKKVNKYLVQDVEDDVEYVDNKMPKFGLLGFGPHGLFAIRTDNREKMLREEFEKIFRGSITDETVMKVIRYLDQKLSDDLHVLLYVHFPSELEASVFGDTLSKAFEDLSKELRVIKISDEKKSLMDLASEYDVVVALTTDPLILLPMGEKLEDEVRSSKRGVEIELLTSIEDETLIESHLKNIVKRVFMVYYAGLYLNLTKDYYEELYSQVKKMGNLCDNRTYFEDADYQKVCSKRYIEKEDYQNACKIPILALAMDKSFESKMVRRFDEILPVVRHSSKEGSVFEILSPDITVTAYDKITEFLENLPSLIVKHVDIALKVFTLDNKEFSGIDIDTFKSEVIYRLIKHAKEEVRSRDIARRIRGIRNIYRLDDLIRI